MHHGKAGIHSCIHYNLLSLNIRIIIWYHLLEVATTITTQCIHTYRHTVHNTAIIYSSIFQFHKLQVLRNDVSCRVFMLPRRSTNVITLLFKQVKWRSIICKYKLLLIVHKVIHIMIPNYLVPLIKISSHKTNIKLDQITLTYLKL